MSQKKSVFLLSLLLILSAADWSLPSASAQQRAVAAPNTVKEAAQTPQTTRQPLKIQRFSIPYGKHRQGRRYQSPPPSMGIDYRRVMPLPESGHNYLKDYYGNHH
ncbi:MAG TPA: hypothetical protein V6C52_14315 [Coleofasciculaceae cyanobacterium]|jgi:hypothetical protein